MMIKSTDVHPGDVIHARDRATIVEDLGILDQRIGAQEAISGPGAWQNCRNCLSAVFFWGLGEVTSDDGDDTYTLKPKYISNANTTTTDAMTTGDMDTTDGIKPEITATAVGDATVSVGDEFLVFGGFDAGEDADEPIVRYFFEARGGAAAWAAFADTTRITTGAPGNGVYRKHDDNGVVTDEARAYYAFELDGGDTVARSFSDLWVLSQGFDLWTYGDRDTGYVLINTHLVIATVTAQYTPGTLVWGAQPAVGAEPDWLTNYPYVMAGSPVYCKVEDRLLYHYGVVANIHGIRLRIDKGYDGLFDSWGFAVNGTAVPTLQWIDLG